MPNNMAHNILKFCTRESKGYCAADLKPWSVTDPSIPPSLQQIFRRASTAEEERGLSITAQSEVVERSWKTAGNINANMLGKGHKEVDGPNWQMCGF